MPGLLLATSNLGKIKEYCFLLDGLGYQIKTLTEQGITKTVTEFGNSYEQNAQLKATAYAELSQIITLADDSGLEVDALDGKPGIYSARFAGKNTTDTDRVKFLLAKLDGIPWKQRAAHFKCVVAIAMPGGRLELCYGECHGIIAFEAKGENGFGYDPIFYLPDIGKTMAEVTFDIKNQISHRAQASKKSRQVLLQLRD